MKKVLIIGSKGMAGHILYHYLKNNTDFSVIDIARGKEFHTPVYELDVTDFSALKGVILGERPDVIVNCIGILNQDAEDHPDKAVLLNSYLPHFLAQAGTEIGCKVIHISTDCVFNGKKGGYTESSEKDGYGFYSQTKALGELNYKDHLTIRTSIIGPELKSNGIGLFHWFMQQTGTIKGYTEAFWTGVTTLELAKAITEAINQDVSGLHHLVNDHKISKYDLTTLFKQTFNKDSINIEPYDGYKVDKSLIKTNDTFQYTVPSYSIMIEEMAEWIKNNGHLYNYNA